MQNGAQDCSAYVPPAPAAPPEASTPHLSPLKHHGLVSTASGVSTLPTSWHLSLDHHPKPGQPNSLSLPASLLSRKSHSPHKFTSCCLKLFSPLGYSLGSLVPLWPLQAPFKLCHPSHCSPASVPQTAYLHTKVLKFALTTGRRHLQHHQCFPHLADNLGASLTW